MRRTFIIIMLFISVIANGQHFPIFSQYMLNGLVINPAYAGSREVLSASVMYRNQWVGFDGAPVTSTLSAHMPLRNKSMALGVLFVNEKIGVQNNISFYSNYAYRFKLTTGQLALGLKAGFNFFKEADSKITTSQPDDLFNNNTGSFLPNFGFGAYYNTSTWFVGASVPEFLSYRKEDNGYKPYNDVNNYNFLLSGGVLFRINDFFKVKPSSLIRYRINSSFQYDLNCNLIMFKDDKLWLGASYRNQGAIVGLVEFQVNDQIRFGYSYDYSLGDISHYNSGSHEILLRYEFRYRINAVNPRYF